MRISHISMYGFPISFSGTAYRLSGGRTYESLDSTLVCVETECGITGWGEICPWGRDYLPEFAEGARAAIEVMSPDLIGEDPGNTASINKAMDDLLQGHNYAKAAIDIACWDILGKKSGLPVYSLLGGRRSATIPLLSSLYHGPIDDMLARLEAARSRGIKSFSAKASGDVATDIAQFQALADARSSEETVIADANAGWSVPAALQVLTAVDGRGLLFEQPCSTLAECERVRARVRSPIILDESAVSVDDMMQIVRSDLADSIHFKISRVGGITKARIFRDFCAVAGLSCFWEASGGSAIADAAAAHVAFSSPPGTPHKFWSCQEYNAEGGSVGGPIVNDGVVELGDEPGLGAEPSDAITRQAIATFR